MSIIQNPAPVSNAETKGDPRDGGNSSAWNGVEKLGRWAVGLLGDVRGILAFTLITLGVLFTKMGRASRVVHPNVRKQISRAGLKLLPLTTFVGLALGLLIIGQTVSLLSQIGAQNLAGTIMVTVVVRELGPLAAALLVLARIGTATVVDLGTARALGEIEALEALGIDPVHFLVVPRVIGLAVSIFCLTIYLILTALLSGYGFAFLQDIPLRPMDYFSQLMSALVWQDFLLLGLKTMVFGGLIGMATCYEGLARPLRLEQVSDATTRAVVQGVAVCLIGDAVFLTIYLIPS